MRQRSRPEVAQPLAPHRNRRFGAAFAAGEGSSGSATGAAFRKSSPSEASISATNSPRTGPLRAAFLRPQASAATQPQAHLRLGWLGDGSGAGNCHPDEDSRSVTNSLRPVQHGLSGLGFSCCEGPDFGAGVSATGTGACLWTTVAQLRAWAPGPEWLRLGIVSNTSVRGSLGSLRWLELAQQWPSSTATGASSTTSKRACRRPTILRRPARLSGFFRFSGGERSGIDLSAEFCEHRAWCGACVWSFAKAAIAWSAML